MIISIWRFSHLALAITSSLFILILAVTGAILAFDPIDAKLEPHISIDDFPNQSLAQIITTTRAKCNEVLGLSVDANGFLSISTIDEVGGIANFYIHPITAEKTGEIREKSALIKFATNLHRSLFLKGLGRFLVGFSSLLLFLIAITGFILILKRQQGFQKLFSKILKENFSQYTHIYLGRLAFIPIVIIALTGVYLSLLRFSIIPEYTISHEVDYESIRSEPSITTDKITFFSQTALTELRSLEFPFSDDPTDYFQVSLREGEVLVNQYTGEILSEISYPIVNFFTEWSTILHTGSGSIFWSTILGISSLSLLFLLYSGFRMSLLRRAHKLKNKYGINECEYLVLVGSESGTTMGFAKLFYEKIVGAGAKAHICQMNEFKSYPKMKQLIVFTATYGQGEAPANAVKFEGLIRKAAFKNPFGYAVIGFGSLSYPDFCKYAFDVDTMLEDIELAKREKSPSTVNNRSWEAFKQWADEWSTSIGLNISIPAEYAISNQVKKKATFEVVNKNTVGDSFLLELKPYKPQNILSGDLLAIYPEDGSNDRLYSVGKTESEHLLIAVKKHHKGLCSNYLSYLVEGDQLNAKVVENKGFYFPTKATKVIMISSGTGIAPFLGMIDENQNNTNIDLYWGGKTISSFSLYKSWVDRSLSKGRLNFFHIALSRELEDEKIYVQDLILKDAEKITQALEKKAVVMICGSLAMQKGVTELLHTICVKHNQKPLSYYQNKKQVLMDCY